MLAMDENNDVDLPKAICQCDGWGLFDAHFFDLNSSPSVRSYLLVRDPDLGDVPRDLKNTVTNFALECVDAMEELHSLRWVEGDSPTIYLQLENDGYLPSESMYQQTVSRLLMLLNAAA